jgi:hypothetical protein
MKMNKEYVRMTIRMLKLPPMSDEQKIIYEHIQQGNNVIVDACAGSGKSTTILNIATYLPTWQIIQLTYNSMLRKEIKEKTNLFRIDNLEVHTFHSLCVRYYHPSASTDTEIRSVLTKNNPPRIPIPDFQLLVLDEAQDMTDLYFQLMMKWIHDSSSTNIQIMVLGDYMQSLYEFKGADIRYLVLADKVWENLPNLKSRIFTKCTLSTSYRITNQIGEFVNHVMLGETRLLTCREGEPVLYFKRNHIHKIIYHRIHELIQSGQAKPGDFFILAGSVKRNKKMKLIENTLSENGIPCYLPTTESVDIDSKIIEGKIVFSTFHSVKGRERKYVFIMGFDNSYMEFQGKEFPKETCPNTLYVAATRANTQLLVFHDEYRKNLSFLKMNQIQMNKQPYIQFLGNPSLLTSAKVSNKEMPDSSNVKIHRVSPTDLIQFLNESVMNIITPIIQRLFVSLPIGEGEEEINLPVLLQTKYGYEDVSDLNGIAIPYMYYDRVLQRYYQDDYNILVNTIQTSLLGTEDDEYTFLKHIIQYELPEHPMTISDYLYLANIHVATKEKIYFRLKQIDSDEYHWITDEMIDQCMIRLDTIIGIDEIHCPKIEKEIINYSMHEENELINRRLLPFFKDKRFQFIAVTDMITQMIVWELKCTTRITIEHLLQLSIYAWIWRTIYPEDTEKEFIIVNIRTGEQMKLIKGDELDEDLLKIVVTILNGKYGKEEKKTDEMFLQMCKDVYLE